MTSIRQRLTRDLLAAGLVLFGAGWLAFFLIARGELIEQFDDALRSKALAVTASGPIAAGRLESSGELSRNSHRDPVRDYFELWAADGRVVGRSESLGDRQLPAAPPRRRPVWNLTLPDGRAGRALFVHNSDGSSLVVAVDRDELDEALEEILTSAAVGGLVLGVIIIWGVPLILRRGLAPLGRVGESVARIGAETLSDRLPTNGLPAELRPIVDRLNQLLGRLELSFERERRFSAYLAHELRTPLAELRTAAECAIKWPDSREPSHDRDVLAIAAHMEALVTRLLALARGDQQQHAPRSVPLDFAASIAEAWAPFAERAAARGLRVRLELPGTVIEADPVLLRSVLTNLFDNAADYTPAQTEIEVRLEVNGTGDVRLTVANTVQELTAEDVAHLFDRLWRKDAARTDPGHLGLGLPLARVLARGMGLNLEAALDATGRRLVLALTAPPRGAAMAQTELAASAP